MALFIRVYREMSAIWTVCHLIHADVRIYLTSYGACRISKTLRFIHREYLR